MPWAGCRWDYFRAPSPRRSSVLWSSTPCMCVNERRLSSSALSICRSNISLTTSRYLRPVAQGWALCVCACSGSLACVPSTGTPMIGQGVFSRMPASFKHPSVSPRHRETHTEKTLEPGWTSPKAASTGRLEETLTVGVRSRSRLCMGINLSHRLPSLEPKLNVPCNGPSVHIRQTPFGSWHASSVWREWAIRLAHCDTIASAARAGSLAEVLANARACSRPLHKLGCLFPRAVVRVLSISLLSS